MCRRRILVSREAVKNSALGRKWAFSVARTATEGRGDAAIRTRWDRRVATGTGDEGTSNEVRQTGRADAGQEADAKGMGMVARSPICWLS